MEECSFSSNANLSEGPARHRNALQAGRAAVLVAAAIAIAAVVRRRMLRWGATDDEVDLTLPGDHLISHADLTATRAITIRRGPDAVWPWIAQLGQGRGGFYTYDFLENLVGADIHSADRIVPEWQNPEVDTEVNLAPEMPLKVALVESRRTLVLRGGIPMGRTPAPYDFTWAFALRDGACGTTRLVVRERYGYGRRWAALVVEPVELISFVMSTRMLRGIKQRAERVVRTTPIDGVDGSLDGIAVPTS